MTSDVDSRAPLAGLRVIEMGAFIAGPYCGQLLADFGADVIKIEPPDSGDPMRQWGVYKVDGRSLWWPIIARNKRCITLDLRRSQGQVLAKRLIQTSDVLVENFRPGTLENWGLSPETLRSEQPRLIVARLSGFGQTGPYRERAAFAAVAEAMGGLRILTGYPDRPPVRVGLSLGDSLAGLFSAFGILAALYERDSSTPPRTGQTIDIAITECVLAILESVISEYSVTGQLRERTGPVLPRIAPSNLYPTKDDSWVIIAANSDALFRRLAVAMGQPGLASDTHYATHDARGGHQEQLDQVISAWTATLSRDELMKLLLEHAIPAGPLHDAKDVANDPHYRQREAIVEVRAADFGTLAMQGVVPKLSGTPGRIRWAGPRLGEHNAQVYGEILGLSATEISRLHTEGII